jgi:tetratricopeptide (TPR) repeat protein
MADALQVYLRHTLPEELRVALNARLDQLEKGDFDKILRHSLARKVFGQDENSLSPDDLVKDWPKFLRKRMEQVLDDDAASGELKTRQHRLHFLLLLAIAALQAFLQSNVTGPPLAFSPFTLLLPSAVTSNKSLISTLRQNLLLSLGEDGEAAYRLTPNIELICLAKAISSLEGVFNDIKGAKWARLRIDFVHQRLLSETSSTLQKAIYRGLDEVEGFLLELKGTLVYSDLHSQFLLEEASIDTHHGMDKQARDALTEAAKIRHFDFAITGLLGKRTKWQERDISQLVVLAKSAKEFTNNISFTNETNGQKLASKPETLNLNDDTLLEAISFTEKSNQFAPDVIDSAALPSSLAALNPSEQPLLHPLDSTILLSMASSITNTQASDGLTREETLPYAVRVLDGGSSNWQVYTQALLVRSRIEGYKSRTIERGLLQLQAVVDQVIAETTVRDGSIADDNSASTFLPRAKEAESASASERLHYIYPLCSPTRWELEAELAARWVALGGLRSALEIYERLEMWAEAALCHAATEHEERAKRIIRRQLFHARTGKDEDADPEEEKWEGPARDPPPAEAPRLYCILGDIDNDPSWWEQAWLVSGNRYARAQRTLGRHYLKLNDYTQAAAAYSKSLKMNQLNQQSWFALGCCLLELSEFDRAVEAFSRTVQLDDSDAEAWSNLAAALLRKETVIPSASQPVFTASEDDDINAISIHDIDPQQNRKDALQALKRAAKLKHESARIWDNLLTVSAALEPPSFGDMIIAQKRIIELRGKAEGEKCIDITILEFLVRHVTASAPSLGLPRMVLDLFDTSIIPLITTSSRLWNMVAVLAMWRGAPGQALEANEKAWRTVTAQPGWEVGTEEQWDRVVEATVDLADAYETLGPKTREGSESVVMKDWKFKARSAIKGVMGKGKDSWDGTAGWERLKTTLDGLKGA